MEDAYQRLPGYNRTIVPSSGKTVEQTMVMPTGNDTSIAAAVGGVFGVDGFDTWDPSFVGAPVEGMVAVVIGPDYFDRANGIPLANDDDHVARPHDDFARLSSLCLHPTRFRRCSWTKYTPRSSTVASTPSASRPALCDRCTRLQMSTSWPCTVPWAEMIDLRTSSSMSGPHEQPPLDPWSSWHRAAPSTSPCTRRGTRSSSGSATR